MLRAVEQVAPPNYCTLKIIRHSVCPEVLIARPPKPGRAEIYDR